MKQCLSPYESNFADLPWAESTARTAGTAAPSPLEKVLRATRVAKKLQINYQDIDGEVWLGRARSWGE